MAPRSSASMSLLSVVTTTSALAVHALLVFVYSGSATTPTWRIGAVFVFALVASFFALLFAALGAYDALRSCVDAACCTDPSEEPSDGIARTKTCTLRVLHGGTAVCNALGGTAAAFGAVQWLCACCTDAERRWYWVALAALCFSPFAVLVAMLSLCLRRRDGWREDDHLRVLGFFGRQKPPGQHSSWEIQMGAPLAAATECCSSDDFGGDLTEFRSQLIAQQVLRKIYPSTNR